MGLISKLAGDLNEVHTDFLQKNYHDYLMDGESIQAGFQLVRDVLMITDFRILEFDRQGTTGQKMRVESIYLDTIYRVTLETAGFGVDDSEMTVHYISTPNLRSERAEYSVKTFRFPKNYDIQGLYRTFQEIAYQNFLEINHI